jgi:hypothetical protein
MDSFSEAVQWRRRCGPSRTLILEEPVIAPTRLLSLSEVGDRVRSIQGLLQTYERWVAKYDAAEGMLDAQLVMAVTRLMKRL